MLHDTSKMELSGSAPRFICQEICKERQAKLPRLLHLPTRGERIGLP
jgi:hypothetical protein